mgnify:CR=1 FL=1
MINCNQGHFFVGFQFLTGVLKSSPTLFHCNQDHFSIGSEFLAGMFKSIIQWRNVEKCLYDKDSSFGYGGFGLRLTRGHGTWIRALILINRPRIALNLKTGKSKRIVFSTDNPDQIMEIAKQQDISTY